MLEIYMYLVPGSSYFILYWCCLLFYTFVLVILTIVLSVMYFLFWPLCCLFFFYLQILIIPLVSSNSSYKLFCFYWSVWTKTWRWGVMYMCVRLLILHLSPIFRVYFELFRLCGTSCFFHFSMYFFIPY